jgi:hypothetical protein
LRPDTSTRRRTETLSGSWRRLLGGIETVERRYVVSDSSTGWAVGDEDGLFIAANCPAHVLRTIQAHRKIIAMHRGDHECSQMGSDGEIDAFSYVMADETCSTLAAVASIYFPEGTEP